VALNGRSGDDTLRVANGLQDEAITIHGDSGDDTILGGNGAETLAGDSGDDFVDGNQGNDTGLLGPGRDTFQWDPGDGSDTVDGDSGRDTLLFNGANIGEIMRLSPNGERSVFTRNVGNIRMDMDHVERLELHALGGVDDVTVDDMSGTDMRRADIDLGASPAGSGQPDGATDTVTVNGTPGDDDIRVDADNGGVEASGLRATTAITGADTTDQLKVNTFTGDSNVRVSAAAKALMQIAVDIGT
jgi:Ca2+-binding RTX toxin-like protein